MRYGPTDPSYVGPNGELPTHLQALAEACERAANLISAYLYDKEQRKVSDVLRAHARAIRAGRVNVRPEAPRVTHCCGAQGFGRELKDRCPACEQEKRVTVNEGGENGHA